MISIYEYKDKIEQKSQIIGTDFHESEAATSSTIM